MTRSRLRSRRHSHPLLLRLSLAVVAAVLAAAGVPTTVGAAEGTYRNPLRPTTTIGDGIVESCADPSVIYGQEGEGLWYMYCTSDPLNDSDKTNGRFNFRLIPMLSSPDLINWTYEGEAFADIGRPPYAVADAALWAPEIEYYPETGMYHLYYAVFGDPATTIGNGGTAIGVATGPTALGPWTHRATPVVEPHSPYCCPGARRPSIDPEVFRTDGQDYIYFGTYFGGVSVRRLSEDGFTSDPASDKLVGIDNKYEGPEVIFREEDGFYYLFMSATDCCRGPLTGYSVYVGRSRSPEGPFLDREGVDLARQGPAGGTPFLSMNGNRWVGTGHNTVLQDFDGQWWTIYHAINRRDPYLAGGVDLFPGNCAAEGRPDDFHGPGVPQTEPGGDGRDDRTGVGCGDLNKRPALLDAVDWVGGWPTVRGGRWVSVTPQHAPAAQPGETTNHRALRPLRDTLGGVVAGLSDEFNDTTLSSQWRWVRPPGNGTAAEGGGVFRFNTQAADLFVVNNTASVLTGAAPSGNYAVETKVRVTVPTEGCCPNFVQAGLVIYGNDDNYLKLVNVSIWNTRQTEWAKELAPVPLGYPRYGNSVVGPPNVQNEWTFLRIVKRNRGEQGGADLYGGTEQYTAYTARDANNDGQPDVWSRGGTWTHSLGSAARIGLVSMGGSGFRAEFDYVRIYQLNRGNANRTGSRPTARR